MKYRHYYCIPKTNYKGDGFYGKVSGIKNAHMIEASTIEEFEEEFHRYVDEYLKESEDLRLRHIRKTITRVFILIVLFVTLIATCPDRKGHVEALTTLTSSLINESAYASDSNDWAFLGAILCNKLIGAIVENSLYVDNYILFSIGKIPCDGEEYIVSFGIFNHVFTKSREQFKEAVSANPAIQNALDDLF